MYKICIKIYHSLAFHSAKSRMENLLNKFPEFANIDNIIMHRVLTEAKMLQIRASLVLHDLQHSYRNCWTIEMTKRCAQMLLKYESVAIVQLYETGMLNENEYAHILKLIQKKIFHLEYGHFVGIPKIYVNEEQDNPFNNISLFADLTEDEKFHFKRLLAPRHKWFQPGEVLLRQGYITLEAYLIVRGIVESSEDLLTCYRSGHIIGIDALFDKSSSVSHRTYKAEGSIVEAFSIDEYMLKMLLSNPKLTRLVYNEIALHLLINMYRQPINLLNYAQIKALLDQHAIFYQSDIQVDVMTIPLKRTERLFLLKGTVQREDDDYFLEGPQLVTVNRSTSFHCSLDQLCIAYRWTVKDEQECLQIARSFTNSFRFSNPNDIERSPSMAYPFCSSYTTQITPQYHSLIQVARSAACTSNTGLIPMEIVNIDHGNI